MIPRDHLFRNPERAAFELSPDGMWLSWLASAAGVMNIWAAPSHDVSQGRQLTFEQRRGITSFAWTFDSKQILFSRDVDGDENWQLYSLRVSDGLERNLTPYPGTRTSLIATSRKIRDRVLISLNKRDPRFADIYTIDLASGAMQLVAENPGFAGYVTDDDFLLRFAYRHDALGGLEVLRRVEDGSWESWLQFAGEDARNSEPSHLDSTGRTLYLLDSRGRDTTALVAIDVQTSEAVLLASDPMADIGGMILDALTYRPVAYSVTYERRVTRVLDESIRADVDFLDSLSIGEWLITSTTEDDTLWLVAANSDTKPSATYLYERASRSLRKLLELRPQLTNVPLARMQPVTVSSRDGLRLVSYVTLPREVDTGEPLRATRPVPMVVVVHGGPWMRDGFGFNTQHQWLADRGYAVLTVNFRSSTGFGKAFINAGDGEWGARMDDDVEDAVQWAVDAGLADPSRLAIMGASYGGFAVLSALTRNPKRYVCGIDIVGPSNLETLMRAIPPHWESERSVLHKAVGNPDTPEGLALLKERSPLHRAEAIEAALLIAQGANDPRVKRIEADQMVDALVARSIPVTYALFPDEGHGLAREPNFLVFNAIAEGFLAKYLGGSAEPYRIEDFPGTSMQLLHGAALLAAA